MKGLVAGRLAVAGLLVSLALYQRHQNDAKVNTYWHENLHPRVHKIITQLDGLGVDTTKAKQLCEREDVTESEADACVSELEHEVRD